MSILTLDVSEVHALASDLRTGADRVEPVAELIIAKTGHDVVATAQVLVPVDTGLLKSDITVDVDGLSFEAGPSVNYGEFQELGTSEMGPQPYLGPAYDMHEPRFEDALGQLGERILR